MVFIMVFIGYIVVFIMVFIGFIVVFMMVFNRLYSVFYDDFYGFCFSAVLKGGLYDPPGLYLKELESESFECRAFLRDL